MHHPVHKVGLLIGSLRRASTNRTLASAVSRLVPYRMRFTEIQIDDLPMYNGDLDSGDRPEAVRRFTQAVNACDAVFIVTPEYNRSVPAVLKNAIDWGSKPLPENVWFDKPVAVTGISPGALGTAFGQQHLRQVLGALGAAVIGGEAYVTDRADMFTDDGDLNPATAEFLRTYVTRFADFTDKLVGAPLIAGGQPEQDCGAADQGGDRVAARKQIAANYFEEMATVGLCAAHERYLHPDVVWTSVDGTLSKDGIIHMGEEIQKHIVGPFTVIPGIMTAEENRVAVEARSDIAMDHEARYLNTYHFLLEFEGGQIIGVHEHYDSAHANEIWEPYAAAMMAKAESWISGTVVPEASDQS